MAGDAAAGGVSGTESHSAEADKNAELSDDELLDILRRQMRGRNARFSSPAFKQKLAEDAMVRRIGNFTIGERIFVGFSDAELETECTCGAPSPELCKEVAFPMHFSECSCQDLSGLVIQGIHPSGSKREGNDVRLGGGDDWSDIDVMIRLGPINILGDMTALRSAKGAEKKGQDKVPETLQEDQPGQETIQQDQGVAESARSSGDALVIRLERTMQPGFVLLRHQPVAGCQHGDWLLFSGEAIKRNIRVIGNIGKTKPLKRHRFGALTSGGPALTSYDGQTDADLVPCLALPRWPCDEFRRRPRPLLQPPLALVERLCRTPAMLVPIGFEGSASQTDQWRLSFSRHEHIMLQSLTELQRDCLAVLKHCCAVLLGPHGDVKGAYLKMALFWECEEASPDTWEAEGVRTMALRVLSRLQEFARLGRLPCYFWSEINMLATRTDTELARLDRAAQCIKVHLLTATAALVALFVRYNDSGVSDPRLPRRRWDLLWEFVLQRAQPVRPEDPLLTETWLRKDNFSMLMGKSSSMNAVYERVFESLVASGAVSPTGVGEELTDDWLAEE